MKLVIAIIHRDDAGEVTQSLTKKGISSTKLSTTGGFLMASNVTLLVGVEEARVQEVIEIIREHSRARKQLLPGNAGLHPGAAGHYGEVYHTAPVEVTVGGGTIFVVDVERFERV